MANLEKVRSHREFGWQQAAAATGVVVSLAFVAVELSQNTKAIQATVRNDLAAASREWSLAQATSPELAEAADKWMAGEEVTRAEFRMVRSFCVALMRNVENVYLQVQNGSVDESALVGYGFRAIPLLRSDRFVTLWPDIRETFHPGFVEAFEEQNPELRPADP